MDARLAVKRPHDDKSTLKYGEWLQQNVCRQTQPFSTTVSRKNNTSKDVQESEMRSGKDGIAFSGSLAEVYEKALNNVLNIQPNFKMDENHNDKNATLEKKPIAALDTRHFQSPGTCKHLHHNEAHLLEHRISGEKRLNPTSKSAFHVPEKRRIPNGQSRYENWSHDRPIPYPVNYPGDYYPVIHPPPFYPRYDNLYLERFNYYPGPRRREFPVFTHVLPWLQFERDYKPMTSPRYGEWCPKATVGYDTRKGTKEKNDATKQQLGLRPLSRDDKSADQKQNKNAGSENNVDPSIMRKDEKCDKSPTQSDLYNVKTRRMRAVEKRNVFNNSGKKDSFGSPKEQFLFSLGLTRVDKYHEG